MWEFKAEKADRLDRLLRAKAFSPWMSRQAWEKALAEGFVFLDGRRVKKPGEQVSAGARIQVKLPELGLVGEGPPARLVWEAPDASWGVFEKPAGLPTYPLYPWERGTFLHRVVGALEERGIAAREFQELGSPPVLEGGLVQRLDTDTSGLVTVAFTKEAKAFCRKLFSGEVRKGYLALVGGDARSVEGKQTLFIPPTEAPRVSAFSDPKAGAVKVELFLKVRELSSSHSLLEVETDQGLRHVVRASLAALGFPLAGDALYGGDPAFSYHLLHAGYLQFPGLGEIRLSAPQSFLDCGKRVGLHYSG